MARKTSFTRDDVVDAAFRVLEAGGAGAVTARRVADTLGASTAPVYSNFANMEELLVAVIDELGTAEVLRSCRRSWTDDPFLNMGIGFVRFAVDHPQLFRAMYLEPKRTCADEDVVEPQLLADLAAHPLLGALPVDHREELFFQASIYTLGIATTVVTGLWPDPDLAVVEAWLRSVGGLLIRAAMESAGLAIPPEFHFSTGEFVVPWRQPGCAATEDDHDES
ncbi:MAG: TetR/AcrR family transcriptional regulator [Candidatus Krumholzibacteriia bacterium]